MKNILTIDQSLNNSGICILQDDGYIFDQIKPSKDFDDVQKLLHIREYLKTDIVDYNIDLLIREGFSYGSIGRAVFQLGGLGFLIDILCEDLCIEEFIIPPTIHKKFTTGRGNSPKSVMLLNIYKKWDIELNDDNVADAMSMMKTYEAYQRYLKGKYEDLTKIQKDTMKKMCKEN